MFLCPSMTVDTAERPPPSGSTWELFQSVWSGHLSQIGPSKVVHQWQWLIQPHHASCVKGTLQRACFATGGAWLPGSLILLADLWMYDQEATRFLMIMKARWGACGPGGSSASWMFSQGAKSDVWRETEWKLSLCGTGLQTALIRHAGKGAYTLRQVLKWERLGLKMLVRSRYDSSVADHKNQMSQQITAIW